jgi:hypothetical protein
MGEAKRRKQLDPNYGKMQSKRWTTILVKSEIAKTWEIAEEGFRMFPESLIKSYCFFRNTIWEYPREEDIYSGYPKEIVDYAKTLEHNIKCEFWSYLLYVRNHRDGFDGYVQETAIPNFLENYRALIYLWKRLFISSSISHLYESLDLDDDTEYTTNEEHECYKRAMGISMELIFDYCYRVQLS